MMKKNFTPFVGSDRYFISDGLPLEFRGGKGFEVFDQCGISYIDFVCGLGPVILGHADREFTLRLSNALNNGLLFPGFGFVHHRLAENFEAFQTNKRVVSFFKTNTEALAAAIRCSALITRRKKMLYCGIAYENASLHWSDFKIITLKKILMQHGHQIAAFIIDIYQLSVMSLSIFDQAIALCQSHGIQIIYDETKTAGRTNPAGYLTNHSIQPDFYVLGNAIGCFIR